VSDSNHLLNSMKIKILHVDDDETCLTTSKLMLLEFDSNLIIDSCPSVDQAIEMLKTGHYDAILSDHEMPQKSGLDFLRILREQKNNIPFILFTGKGREEVAIQALNLGADGYQHKQGSPETVFGELSHRLITVVSYSKTKNSLLKSEQKFRKAFETLQQKEISLRKSEARWAATLSSVGDAVIATDIDGKITFMNQVAEQLTGWTLNDAMNKALDKIFCIMNETTGKIVESPVAKVLRTGLIVGLANHTILVRKDGSKIPIDDSGALANFPVSGENTDIWKCFSIGAK
jgi:PAS domain S-box-containing protein